MIGIMKELKKFVDKHTQAGVAKMLGMSQRGVGLWFARGRIPAERVIELERVSGIPREKLRPDLYAKQRRRSSPKSSR